MAPATSRLLRALPLVVLALALLLRSYPHLVYRVPKVGFILGALALGLEIPPYFTKDMFAHDAQWLKSGDVVVSCGAKAGTTWTLFTLHAIRTRGAWNDFDDLYAVTPFVDAFAYPGQSVQERVQTWTQAQSRYPFGVFKTHFGPKVFTVRKDVKYIVPFRKAEHMFASFIDMARNTYDSRSRKEYVQLTQETWGGFPIVGSPEDMRHMILHDMGNGQAMFETLVLAVIREWWQYRNEPNVLFLRYEDRVVDREADLERILAFLGPSVLSPPITPAEKRAVLEASSFENMKKIEAKFDGCRFFNIGVEGGHLGKEWYNMCMTKNLMNDGVRGGKAAARTFTDEEKIHFDAMVLKWLGPEIAAWIENGGPIPNVEPPPM